MSEPAASLATAAISAITAGAMVGTAPQVAPMLGGFLPLAIIYAAALGAALFVLGRVPGDIKARLYSWALGTFFGVVLTVGLMAVAGSFEVTKPLTQVPAWVVACLLGFLGVIFSERLVGVAQSVKIPGVQP